MWARASAFRSSNVDAPANDLATEVDEVLDHLQQAEHPRPRIDDAEHDDAERLLQLRVLVEVVEDDLFDLAALQLDDHAHAVAIGLVAKIRDAFDRLVAHEIGDALQQLRLVDLVGDLGDDDLRPIALLRRLDFGLRAHLNRAAAGDVRLVNASPADDHAAGGEVGAGNEPDQLLELLIALSLAPSGGLSSVFSITQITPSTTSAEIVRRDVGRHPDRDTGRSVDQQIRIRSRKDRRLGRRLVEVRERKSTVS